MTMRVTTVALALVAWAVTGVAVAHAQVVFPVSTAYPFPPNTASTVTLTLSPANFLPTPGGTVTLTVNSGGQPLVPQPQISLVCPGGSLTTGALCAPATGAQSNPIVAQALTTSAYPGTCTNSGLSTDLSADYTISGNQLTSHDCGGMAVVRVTVNNVVYNFIVPQDSNFNGMPDTWEAQYSSSLTASGDNDGDGWSNMDEYRGVMVAGQPVRLHPLERDLFMGFVNPGCTTALNTTLLGAGGYVPDLSNGLSLFDNLKNLLPATRTDPGGPRIHVLGYPSGAPTSHGATGEWVDNYTTCAFDSTLGDLTFTGLTDLDRNVMVNALYQVSESPLTTLTPSAATGKAVTFTAGSKVFNQSHVLATLTSANGGVATIVTVPTPTQATADISATFGATTAIAAGSWRLSGADQKGLRCVESLDNTSTTIYAKSTWTTPDDTHQCSIFSARIKTRMLDPTTGLIPKGGTRLLKVVTSTDGGRTWGSTAATVLFDQANCNGCSLAEAQRRVVAEVMRFYITMEYGHGGKLNPALGTCANHDCAGTGYLNDKDFTQVIDSKTGGYNTFRIPTIPSSTLTSNFKLRNP